MTVMSKRLPSLITVSEGSATAYINHFSVCSIHPFVSVLSSSPTSFLPFIFSSHFITLQLQLICSSKLGPSTSLSLRLGRARVSWVRRRGGQNEKRKNWEQAKPSLYSHLYGNSQHNTFYFYFYPSTVSDIEQLGAFHFLVNKCDIF